MELKKLLHNCPKVYFWMLLFKRGPKAPRRAQRTLGAQRAPKPSAGARRRGAEHPKLLVTIYSTLHFIRAQYNIVYCGKLQFNIL